MIYLSITQIDADTGIVCTQEPMRTGPAYPQIKNCNIIWCNKSTWPIDTTAEGAHTRPPLFFGTCDNDADLSVSGVVPGTYTLSTISVDAYGRVTFANTGSASAALTANSLTTSNFSVLESGGKLIFKYGATVIASMGANGIFISANNIIAGGTP